ncbi:MAG TPA: hypothetical protein PLD55_04210 [bacterium]|nr:hypothetical protein [bacterium]
MINFKTDDNGNILVDENGNFIDLTALESIAQNIRSRLRTKKGEWFLDTEIGLDWKNGFEKGGENTLLYSVKAVILGTIGVINIANFSHQTNKSLRQIKISAKINTVEGEIYINEEF